MVINISCSQASSQEFGLWSQEALQGSQPAQVSVNQVQLTARTQQLQIGWSGGGVLGKFTFSANQICQGCQKPDQATSSPNVWHV